MNRDSDLRAQFENLKRQDARSARPFPAIWDDACFGLRRKRRWTLNPVAIAAVIVALIAPLTVHLRHPRPVSAIQVSHWQSPTAGLLHPPGSELVTALPRFGEPVIPSFKEHRN